MRQGADIIRAGLVAELMAEAGISEHELARRLGSSTNRVRTLIASRRMDSLTLSDLAALADTFGVAPQYLLASTNDGTGGPPTADSVTLQALLTAHGAMAAREDVATALGWSLARLRTATTELASQLNGSGCRLYSTWGIEIRADTEKLAPDAVQELARRTQRRRGATMPQTRLLAKLLMFNSGSARSQWIGRSGKAKLMAIGALMRLGWIERPNRTFEIPDEVLYGLRPARAARQEAGLPVWPEGDAPRFRRPYAQNRSDRLEGEPMKRMDIVKTTDGWKAESNGRTVPGTKAPTKEATIKQTASRAKASAEPVSVRIHKQNGRIQEERTYPRSADPRRSRG